MESRTGHASLPRDPETQRNSSYFLPKQGAWACDRLEASKPYKWRWTAGHLRGWPPGERSAPAGRRAGRGRGGHPAYPDALGPAQVVGRQGALRGQRTLLVLGLQVQLVRFRLVLQGRLGFRRQRRDCERGLLRLVQAVQSCRFSLIELLLGGKVQQVLKSQSPAIISLPR